MKEMFIYLLAASLPFIRSAFDRGKTVLSSARFIYFFSSCVVSLACFVNSWPFVQRPSLRELARQVGNVELC